MAQEATGSIWNANNWHWEEKSHSKRAQTFLKEALEGSTELKGKDFEIFLTNVTVNGDATTSVRKQKLLVALDLSLKADWGVRTDGREPSVCGRLEARELSEESSEDGDFYFTCASTSSGDAVPFQQEALTLLKKQGKTLVQTALQRLVLSIRSQESDKEKLAQDKEQRQSAAAASQKAREETGEQQKDIARQQKAADAARKEAASQAQTPQKIVRTLFSFPSPPARSPSLSANNKRGESLSVREGETGLCRNSSQETALAGTGSVWNTNSYHWEEKPMTQWCISTLTERLEKLKIAISNDIEVCFFNVKATGEASTSIRKAKKIVIFDLELRADWKATARNSEGSFLGDTKGSVTVKEFSSDNAEEFVLTLADDEGLPPQKKIGELVKKEAPSQLRHFLSQFVEDLKARG